MNDAPFRPANDTTSTKYITVMLSLAGPPKSEAIGAAIDSVQLSFDHYPRGQVQVSQALAITPAGVPAQAPATLNEPAGFQFDYVLPDGTLTRVLACSENTLRFTRAPPQSIPAIAAEALPEFSAILPPLAQSVADIGLERLDRFLWEAPRSEFRADAVLRAGSDWITPKVFQAPDLWHSYHGLFEYLEEPCHHRLLHVFEASARTGPDVVPLEVSAAPVVVDIKQRLRVSNAMTSSESVVQLLTPDALLAGEAEGSPSILLRYLEHLVDRSNTVLRDALSANALKSIAAADSP